MHVNGSGRSVLLFNKLIEVGDLDSVLEFGLYQPWPTWHSHSLYPASFKRVGLLAGSESENMLMMFRAREPLV